MYFLYKIIIIKFSCTLSVTCLGHFLFLFFFLVDVMMIIKQIIIIIITADPMMVYTCNICAYYVYTSISTNPSRLFFVSSSIGPKF